MTSVAAHEPGNDAPEDVHAQYSFILTGFVAEFTSAALPEPSMLAVLALGIIGLGAARRQTR
jgi:hypothetical protein